MNENAWMAERFEQDRSRLKSVAHRMLGSATEADDAVQETWLRFSRSDVSEVANLSSWLTTVVSRVCLSMLQSRRSRPSTPIGPDLAEPVNGPGPEPDPEHEALIADSVGLALMVVLDRLTPAERVALVLHDMFGVPFEDIGAIVGRSAPAARQLASRARRRVRGPDAPGPSEDRLRQARLVEAFLAASKQGDFEALLAVLDPEVVLRADSTAADMGAAPETRGAVAVARFCRRARGAEAALADGIPAAVWIPGGQPRVLFHFTVSEDDKITAIDLVADPEQLQRVSLELP